MPGLAPPFFCLVFVLLATAAARGETPAGDEPIRPHFPQGTWTFQTYAGYLNDLGPQDTEGGFLSTGVGYFLWDGVSLSAEVSGYGISQPGDETLAGAIGVVLRHHLIERDHSSFFIDVAFAPIEALHRVPSGGTRFNYVTQCGIGLVHGLKNNSNLLLGVRYIHVSNAGLEGGDRNPSINGVSMYVGLMFRL